MKLDPAAPSPEAPHPSAPAPGDGARSHALLIGIFIVGVLAVALVLRFLTTSDLWLDEALTVNIAKVPISGLEEALKRDGAPPLYYVLLHYWIRIFGSSDVAVRALSGVLGVIMLPLAYIAGRRLGGGDPVRSRWAGWTALLLVASSPYTIRYSTETRMYMLTMVLVLLAYLAVWWAIRKPSFLPCFCVAILTAAVLYTQYWAFFLVGAFAASQIWVVWRNRGEARRTAILLLLALVAAALLFIPWVPSFLYQMKHTGTPWDTPTSPPTNAALGIIDFAGGRMIEGWTLALPLVLLALLALFGRSRDKRYIELDLHTVPGVRWEWFIGAATLFGGLTLSFVAGTGFQSRYAAVMFPLFVLAVALGITVLGDRRIRYALIVLIVAVGFVGGVRNVVTNRTQASQVTDKIAEGAKRGDIVAYCPDQLGPDVSRLLPNRLGLQQVAFPNLQSPKFVNWVDYADRNAKASVDKFTQRLLASGSGRTIWFVSSPNYRTFGGKCEQALALLATARPHNEGLVFPDDKIYEFMGLTRFDP